MFNYNQIKTVFLLGSLSALLLFMGALIGGQSGLTIALIMALIMNVVAYFFSDSIVLSMYKAQPLDKHEHAWIYQTVSKLAQEMDIPMPKLWLINHPMANAFATGRNPAHASVALTTGIMKLLNKRELTGVLAHELSHVKNRDILVSTIAAVLATAIGYLASMLRFNAFFGRRDEQQGKGNGLFMLLAALIMPFAATLLQLAISRSREYLADETGAACCKDPEGLASALEKLHNHIPDASLNKQDVEKASTAPLFIVHPFTGSDWTALFSTHPPIALRIARLRKMLR